MMGRLAGGDIS